MVLGSGTMNRSAFRYAIRGFTLLELLIVLAVISVLAAISIVSYSQYTIRANRADAKIALTRLAQQEERYYSTYRLYLTDVTPKKALEEFGRADGLSDKKLYTLKVTEKGEAGYEITATAAQNKSQYARDEKCRVFSLDNTGKEVAKSKDGVDTTEECWGR